MSDKIKTTKEEREAKKALKLAQEKERIEITSRLNPIYYLTMQLQYRVLTLNKYLLSRVMQKVFQLQVPV